MWQPDWLHRYSYTLVTPPAVEPVTLDEAKEHCRIDHSDDDPYVDGLIAAARQHVEKETRQSLITQTWRLSLDAFPDARGYIGLSHGPVQSVSSIVYRDGNNVSQTLNSSLYALDATSLQILPIVDEYWPSYTGQIGAVQITFVAGYGLAAAVPQHFKHAIFLILGHWYAQREAVTFGDTPHVVPMAAQELLANSRVPTLA